MADLSAVIAELEGAAAGSRKLDEAIGKSQGYREGVNIGMSPRYTTSLDAALTLVPEGWCLFGLRQGDPTLSKSNPDNRCWASIKPHQQNDDGWVIGVQGSPAETPALALCIAALKARSVSTP